jgi:hypothetical protein
LQLLWNYHFLVVDMDTEDIGGIVGTVVVDIAAVEVDTALVDLDIGN